MPNRLIALARAESRDGKLNVRGVVGTTGYLSVTKNLGMRDTYQGTVELISGEIVFRHISCSAVRSFSSSMIWVNPNIAPIGVRIS